MKLSARLFVVLFLCVGTLPARAGHISDAAEPEEPRTTEEAVNSIKDALSRTPDDRDLRRRLGVAYYNDGNDFWAIKILSILVNDYPDDCEARAWLAMAYLRRAFPDNALTVAGFDQCSGPLALRLNMVKALALKALGKAETADETVLDAKFLPAGFAADVAAINSVQRRINPDAEEELSWMLEATGGYTTNARMGSIADDSSVGAAAGRADASALTTIDARLRIVPDFGGPVRGVLEFQPRFQWYFGDAARKYSFFEMTGQIGVMIRRVLPRVYLGYRPDFMLLPEGFRTETDPVWYMESHRGEFEVEIRPEIMVFGGAGIRKFSEISRSRIEADLGLGGSIRPTRDLTVLWAASGRYYNANHEAWDLAGGSTTAAFVMKLKHDMSARVSAILSFDYYPHSAANGDVDPFSTPENRKDLFMKVGGQLWSPSLRGVRFGASYDFSYRDSSADFYSFTDHRVQLRVRWSGSAALRHPKVVATPDDVEVMDWGSGPEAGLDERVRDMLRQDEQSQRSSSCLN